MSTETTGGAHGELLTLPPDQEFDETSERILEATRRELLDHGLRRTSLDEIARAAGVGRATLFRRFPNRDALMLTLAAREARGAIARVDKRITAIEDPVELLVESTLGVIEQITGNGLLQRLLVTDTEQVLPLMTTRSGPMLKLGTDYIASQLDRIAAMGAKVPERRAALAELLARVTLSLAVNPEGELPLNDPAEMAETVRDLVAPLISPTGNGR